MAKHVIYGAPGTGKTTFLIKIIEKYLEKGIKPEEIAFCSFSRSASHEAIERSINRFGFEKSNIPYFGTIHSICYKQFCLGKKLVDKKEFFDKMKIEYKEVDEDEDFLANYEEYSEDGNVIMNFYDKLRLKFCKNIYEIDENKLKNYFYELPISDDNYFTLFGGTFNLYNILRKYEEYKKENDVVDFIDMLLYAYKTKWVIPTKILIVDEFQDLSPLQYEIYKIWSEGKEEIYIAGDDNQAIYSFICANPHFLIKERETLNKENGDEEIFLKKTYRLPEKINKYSLEFIKQNIKGKMIEKNVESLKKGGDIILVNLDKDLDKILNYIRFDKFTFILFRTNYYKNKFIDEVLIPNGIVYDIIRGNSIWNKKNINLFNACVKLHNKKNLSWEEVKYLIENIPYKLGLIKRGLKSYFKDLSREEEYDINKLIEIGFDIKLFDYINDYEKMFNLLKISDKVKQAFIAAGKNIIQYPIKIKVGTIHSAKGKEADDVILFKDVSFKIVKNLVSDDAWDNEIRVFYVGISRPRERLVIVRGGFENSEADVIP